MNTTEPIVPGLLDPEALDRLDERTAWYVHDVHRRIAAGQRVVRRSGWAPSDREQGISVVWEAPDSDGYTHAQVIGGRE